MTLVTGRIYRTEATGQTTDPLNNTDMISPAFWLVSGNENTITRYDNSQDISLLQTTGNCLGKQTFRSKVTSYGDFRNGTVWASDQCLGVALCNMEDSAKQLTGLNKRHAAAMYKVPTRSASGVSGVTGTVEMVQ